MGRVCTLSSPCLRVSLSPSALTEPSECDSIENVPRFQTLRFNVQAHQSRAVIYWLKLWLCIRIRTEAAALVSQRAVLQQDILAQGESLEAQWRSEETFIKALYISLFLVHSLTNSVTCWLTQLFMHFLIHSLTCSLTPLVAHPFSNPLMACSLSYLLRLTMCTDTGIIASCELKEVQVQH